ncbi:50S ribosomal protein L27 [Caldicellulosiruptor sp. F32]|nr:50S ribosomal protein L27 [Caldicellulosiruptor sp. F32]
MFALVNGYVKFETKRGRKFVSVIPAEEMVAVQ